MARKLGEGAAARRRRSAGQPQHRGHRRDQRTRNGIAAPRKRPAAGQVAAPRRSHRAGHAPARRVGGDALERVRAGLQHPSGEETGSAQDLGRSARPEVERQTRHRAGGLGLARGAVRRSWRGQGHETFQGDRRKKGMSVRKGHTLLTQLVVSGEVPLALTVYNYKAEQFKGKGAPIDWFSIGTAIARPNGVGVARRAPHPHAAVLFYDFEIGEEGQKILAQRDFVPTIRKIDTPLNKLPLKFVDARVTLDEYDKWAKLYEEIFGKGR